MRIGKFKVNKRAVSPETAVLGFQYPIFILFDSFSSPFGGEFVK